MSRANIPNVKDRSERPPTSALHNFELKLCVFLQNKLI